ncbi:septum site-determining protein MinC [Methylopila sp. M107]|uniref:septum site-determining protein MinC n=1 Tax=Methylopila sp. M107 TaxID=1101190 RepID=UPI0024766FC8|nr:septum site-determining protein MinC [Methylopila sp. M107]
MVPKHDAQQSGDEPGKRKPVRFKGRSFMALVLTPEPPTSDWLDELDALAARSPGFFGDRPVVLDVSLIKLSPRTLAALLGDLSQRGVRLIGVEGCDPKFLDGPNARLAMPVGGRAAGEITAPEASVGKSGGSLIVNQPIRSGQSVSFQGDVTICGSVASGAEVVASGSIHVYGALRGRAIAGSAGDGKARIFCRKLDAELLAIDGVYMTTDDLDKALRGKAVTAFLDGEALRVAALD